MADFDSFFATLLRHEGGFVDHPSDPGGATNKGITFATFQQSANMLGLEPTLENLKALSDEQAKVIYRHRYWNVIHGDEIEDQAVAEQIFDFYVNAGRNAIKVLQRTLNEIVNELVVDGVFGRATLVAVNEAYPETLYRRYRANRIDYYRWISRRNPNLKVFLRGWEKRANSFQDY